MYVESTSIAYMFNQHEQFISKIVQTECEQSMSRVVKEAVVENAQSNDSCVALDGSWQHQSHTPLYGVVTLTSVDTRCPLGVTI